MTSKASDVVAKAKQWAGYYGDFPNGEEEGREDRRGGDGAATPGGGGVSTAGGGTVGR